MIDYKNNIFMLRNIHKSNDIELIDYNFKKFYLRFMIIIKKIEILIKLFIILIIVLKNIILIYILNY